MLNQMQVEREQQKRREDHNVIQSQSDHQAITQDGERYKEKSVNHLDQEDAPARYHGQQRDEGRITGRRKRIRRRRRIPYAG